MLHDFPPMLSINKTRQTRCGGTQEARSRHTPYTQTLWLPWAHLYLSPLLSAFLSTEGHPHIINCPTLILPHVFLLAPCKYPPSSSPSGTPCSLPCCKKISRHCSQPADPSGMPHKARAHAHTRSRVKGLLCRAHRRNEATSKVLQGM